MTPRKTKQTLRVTCSDLRPRQESSSATGQERPRIALGERGSSWSKYKLPCMHTCSCVLRTGSIVSFLPRSESAAPPLQQCHAYLPRSVAPATVPSSYHYSGALQVTHITYLTFCGVIFIISYKWKLFFAITNQTAAESAKDTTKVCRSPTDLLLLLTERATTTARAAKFSRIALLHGRSVVRSRCEHARTAVPRPVVAWKEASAREEERIAARCYGYGDY